MKKVATAILLRPLLSSNSSSLIHHHLRLLSTTTSKNNKSDDKEWNDAWETAWLPEDTHAWDADVNIDAVGDSDTKAFVEDMNQNWDHRRSNRNTHLQEKPEKEEDDSGFDKLENDYRLKKQRIHASLWSQQIHQLQQSKLDDDGGGGNGGDDIENLLHSCSEIFESGGNDASATEFKNKPDGWETTSKPEDGNVWEMSQREEDILLQEFERRSAFCKFQIASFIKTHIFSRRRPIDGWKYMIEVIGPNAKKGKGSVSRIPGLADPATQPFTEERQPVSGGRLTPRRAR